MTNVFQKIGHGVAVFGEDVEKGVVAVVTYLPKVEKVVATAIKDQPAVKTAIQGLIAQAANVVGDVSLDVAAKGLNLAADAKTLADAEAFFAYFQKTFLPAIAAVYAEVKTDLQ